MRNPVLFLLQLVFAGCLLAANQTVNVPGTSDPWLAGMPTGSTASCGLSGGQCDVAPAEAPPPIAVAAGSTLSITATGLECYGPVPPCAATGPDGNPSVPTPHVNGAQNGLSTITAPANALLGVFLGPNQPSLMPPPTQLGSNTAPVLQQVFLIGSSSRVTVPAEATRLCFGPMDGFGWYDNYGSFTVTISLGCPGQSQSTTMDPCITAPLDGASPQSQFVAISGTGTPGEMLDVIVGGLPIGSVVVDPEGNWEALPYVSLYGSSVTVQVQDQTSSNSSNAITVHPSLASFLPGPTSPPNSLTVLLPLRKTDIFVTASYTSPQSFLYGPNYTHTALYLGGDHNGTPLIAEAVTATEAGSLIGTAGQVRSIPLDQSLAWTQSQRISAWHPRIALPGATRSAIVTWAQSITSQGLPYWSTVDFGLIPAAHALFFATGGTLSPRFNAFLNEINTLTNSTSTFICSTLVWRAYYEGTSHTLDLSNPNLMSTQPGSLIGGYSPAFIAQLAAVFVVPETFARSPQLKQIF